MKIVTLIENTPGIPGCCCEHGLSLYIETERHRILADTGASGIFLKNARMLGIDLRKIDLVVVSHGHYDHAGGVLDFARMNPEAKIYIHWQAGGRFFHLKETGEKYIGIEPEILTLPQCCLTEGEVALDEEVSLFSEIGGRKLWPEGNLELKREVNGKYIQDNFEHEQCLVISRESRKILISGCAHNGILNILDRYEEIYHGRPEVVISGFHMKKQTEYTQRELDQIRKTAQLLKETGSLFYTGHCTGQRAFEEMKAVMGEQLQALHSGETVLEM